ncbi:PleD family two-component system response regulator [Chloroflexota bacterium]
MEPKVLVVDDDARTLRVMEAMLVSAGYSVILAENGAEAITKTIESSPDVILLDVMMPEIDGFEVAKRLQTIIETKDIPIVMVTALGDVKDRVKALEMGADDFLTKPVDKKELLARVKSLVEKSERIKQQLIVVEKMSLVPIVSIILTIIVAVASIIFIATKKPETVIERQVEYREVIREVTKEVIKEVPIVEKQIEYRAVVTQVVKEVTVEKPIEQGEFSSKEDLEKWLAEDDAETTLFRFVVDDGTEVSSDEYDCDDYALALQRRANKDGYQMSVTIIRKHGQLHMINLAVIGNDVYYIEPQNDEVSFYCNLD